MLTLSCCIIWWRADKCRMLGLFKLEGLKSSLFRHFPPPAAGMTGYSTDEPLGILDLHAPVWVSSRERKVNFPLWLRLNSQRADIFSFLRTYHMVIFHLPRLVRARPCVCWPQNILESFFLSLCFSVEQIQSFFPTHTEFGPKCFIAAHPDMDRNRKWAPGFGAALLILVSHLTSALEVPLDRKYFPYQCHLWFDCQNYILKKHFLINEVLSMLWDIMQNIPASTAHTDGALQ